MLDIEVLARVLSALVHSGEGPGQRAWAALAGMTTRICGRYSAEGRAVEAACAVSEPADRVLSTGLAQLLIQRTRSDTRFASGFVPWLAAAQMLLPDVPVER